MHTAATNLTMKLKASTYKKQISSSITSHYKCLPWHIQNNLSDAFHSLLCFTTAQNKKKKQNKIPL